MHVRGRRPVRGFSLPEILIACTIMGLTSAMVYPLFVSSQQMQVAGKYRILAANFARETMEMLRFRRLSDLAAGEGVDPIKPDDHFFNTQLNALRQIRIADVEGEGFAATSRPAGGGSQAREERSLDSAPRGKLIVVTVSWDAAELGPGARSEERLVLYRSNALPLVLFP